MNEEKVVAMIRAEKGVKSFRRYADELGCSGTFLFDVLNGRRRPSDKMLERLGLRRVETKTVKYIRAEEPA
jgi:hypothetical protein